MPNGFKISELIIPVWLLKELQRQYPDVSPRTALIKHLKATLKAA